MAQMVVQREMTMALESEKAPGSDRTDLKTFCQAFSSRKHRSLLIIASVYWDLCQQASDNIDGSASRWDQPEP